MLAGFRCTAPNYSPLPAATPSPRSLSTLLARWCWSRGTIASHVPVQVVQRVLTAVGRLRLLVVILECGHPAALATPIPTKTVAVRLAPGHAHWRSRGATPP